MFSDEMFTSEMTPPGIRGVDMQRHRVQSTHILARRVERRLDASKRAIGVTTFEYAYYDARQTPKD